MAFAITRGAARHSKSFGKAFKAQWVRKPTAFPSLLQSFVSCYVLWVGKPLVYAITGDLEFYYSEFFRVGKPLVYAITGDLEFYYSDFSGLESPLLQLSGLESPCFFVLRFKKRIKRAGKPYSSAASRHSFASYMCSSLLKAQDEKK